jgi:hypothetical protein
MYFTQPPSGADSGGANRIIVSHPDSRKKTVSSAPAGPRCPRCHRPLAAWRLNHCVYCGEAFPADLKEGFEAPDALKWVERPVLPADVTKKLEMMKVVPSQAPRKSRNLMAVAGLVSIPIFGAIFYLAYSMLRQLSPTTSFLILVAGAGVIGYLAWTFYKARR